MRTRFAPLLPLLSLLAGAQTLQFARHDIANLGEERVTGSAIFHRKLITWGDRLQTWSIPEGKSVVALGPQGPFAEGGVILDVNGDGQPDIVLNEDAPGRALVWFEAPRWTRRIIDTGVDTADVLPAELFGRRGILVVHRRAQVRFYEIPPRAGDRWPMREIYSFYTPSDQGGLLVADVDGDSRPDILCGNYWIRAPESFELPWRLFAIELWNEEAHSAMLRVALLGPRELIAMQREMPGARFARFEKPADPKQLWVEHRIGDSLALDHAHVLDVADFDGDGRLDLVVGESRGGGRLLVFHNEGNGSFEPHAIAAGVAAGQVHAIDWDGDGRPDILTIGKGLISLWTNETRRQRTRP